MPIERSSLQFKLWILLLVISAILVFVAFKTLEKKVDDSFIEPGPEVGESDYSQDYLSVESNETIEEELFGQFKMQTNVFYSMLVIISLVFVGGFVIKFFQDRKKEK